MKLESVVVLDVQWIIHFDLNLLVLLPLPYASTHVIEYGYGDVVEVETTLWSHFSSSIFIRIPRIELGLLGFATSTFTVLLAQDHRPLSKS